MNWGMDHSFRAEPTGEVSSEIETSVLWESEMKLALWPVLCILSLPALVSATDKTPFSGDDPTALNVVEKLTETSAGFTVQEIRFSGVDGDGLHASLVSPQKAGPHAAILFVHWLGPVNSDRREFLAEAKSLAADGAISLLVDMPWSDPKWFESRKLSDDYEFSIRQVKNLRRALNVLLLQKDVDKRRVALVGHDFGAMYGSLLAGTDPRVHYAVFMSATPVFSDWFLLGAKIEGREREEYKAKIAPLDPTNFAAKKNSLPVLFQFSKHDEYVPETRAQSFFQSASAPKEVLWYDAGHELNAQAANDREKWLKAKLKLSGNQ
jgi:predicted esterase